MKLDLWPSLWGALLCRGRAGKSKASMFESFLSQNPWNRRGATFKPGGNPNPLPPAPPFLPSPRRLSPCRTRYKDTPTMYKQSAGWMPTPSQAPATTKQSKFGIWTQQLVHKHSKDTAILYWQSAGWMPTPLQAPAKTTQSKSGIWQKQLVHKHSKDTVALYSQSAGWMPTPWQVPAETTQSKSGAATNKKKIANPTRLIETLLPSVLWVQSALCLLPLGRRVHIESLLKPWNAPKRYLQIMLLKFQKHGTTREKW